METELPAASQNENEQISLSIKQNWTFVVIVNVITFLLISITTQHQIQNL